VGVEYLYQCHASNREIIILKLDFEKAFDMVEHNSILRILQAIGFPVKWCTRISHILGLATSSVLLNGVPGKDFQYKRGVRQGIHSPHCYLSWQQIFCRV
jgi:hypothetical protein